MQKFLNIFGYTVAAVAVLSIIYAVYNVVTLGGVL